jgi:hypothetical protein
MTTLVPKHRLFAVWGLSLFLGQSPNHLTSQPAIPDMPRGLLVHHSISVTNHLNNTSDRLDITTYYLDEEWVHVATTAGAKVVAHSNGKSATLWSRGTIEPFGRPFATNQPDVAVIETLLSPTHGSRNSYIAANAQNHPNTTTTIEQSADQTTVVQHRRRPKDSQLGPTERIFTFKGDFLLTDSICHYNNPSAHPVVIEKRPSIEVTRHVPAQRSPLIPQSQITKTWVGPRRSAELASHVKIVQDLTHPVSAEDIITSETQGLQPNFWPHPDSRIVRRPAGVSFGLIFTCLSLFILMAAYGPQMIRRKGHKRS